jgi:hypothetical protein
MRFIAELNIAMLLFLFLRCDVVLDTFQFGFRRDLELRRSVSQIHRQFSANLPVIFTLQLQQGGLDTSIIVQVIRDLSEFLGFALERGSHDRLGRVCAEQGQMSLEIPLRNSTQGECFGMGMAGGAVARHDIDIARRIRTPTAEIGAADGVRVRCQRRVRT